MAHRGRATEYCLTRPPVKGCFNRRRANSQIVKIGAWRTNLRGVLSAKESRPKRGGRWSEKGPNKSCVFDDGVNQPPKLRRTETHAADNGVLLRSRSISSKHLGIALFD